MSLPQNPILLYALSKYQRHKVHKMALIIDPSKQGLEKVLRDYQIEALKIVWNSEIKGLSSREVYVAVNRVLGDRAISRASIINFLNDMCDEGVLKYTEETCKGGTRRRYFTGMNEAAFKKIQL